MFVRNTMKVARWEIKRNLKNKTFIVSLFLTPILFVVFAFLGSLIGGNESDKQVQVLVNDELGVFNELEAIVDQYELRMELTETDIPEAESKLKDVEDTAYVFLNEKVLTEGIVPVYISEEFPSSIENELQFLAQPLKMVQLQQLGLDEQQLAAVSQNIMVDVQEIGETGDGKEKDIFSGENPIMQRLVPGVFAGIILLSIIFTGTMIFQSASQEKKDKIAEIILSSVTPNELMQGKIIGYFVLALIQALVFIVFVLGFVLYKFSDFPLLEYLIAPSLLLFLIIAVLGYLLYASIYVGLGATMSDISTAGNFQSLILMIPFISFFFFAPVINSPTGILAQVLTYIPFTSPTILLLRLILLDEWSWIEISLSIAILILAVWLMMKLAGKIFKVGMLMYGKNATPGEIIKWLRA